MKFSLQDPAVSISLGIILIGFALLVWAAGQLFKKNPPPEEDFLTPEENPPVNELFSTDPLPPPSSFREAPSPAPAPRAPERGTGKDPAPAPASKEMVDRLDTMSQRLTDMQGVLQRQAATAAPGAALTPETIDKLLKIISNVSQQVDSLQRSIGATPSATATNPSAPSASGRPAPAPAAASPAAGGAKPTPTPAPGPAGGKGIGVLGGALSRQVPPAGNPPENPPAK